MPHHRFAPRFIALRAGMGLLLLALAGVACVTADSPAQDPSGKGAKAGKADPGGQPPKGGQRVEEEEDNAKAKRKIIRVDDDAPKPKEAARPEPAPVTDLAQAARQAKNPAVKALFSQLAVPHDVLTFKAFPSVEGQSREKPVNIAPFPQLVGDNPKVLQKAPVFDQFDDEWRLKKSPSPSPVGTIKSIHPYEWVARDAVKKFLDEPFEALAPADARYLSRYDKYVYAEQALAAVLRYHESARLSGARQGEGWDDVGDELRQKLLDVSLKLLDELTLKKDWDAAFELARRLANTYPGKEEQARIAKPLTKVLREALDRPDFTGDKFREVRERWRQLARQFPGDEAVEQIKNHLRQQAKDLFDQAKKEKDPTRVQELLKQASEFDPDLPELRAELVNQFRKYPVLRVGVRQLPQYLSPGLATTDVEVRAVELLFEGLVKTSPDGRGGVRYEPGLAEGRPRVAALGREFQLPANAAWSNGKPITVADIRHTLRLWRQGRGTGRSAAWCDLFADRDEVTSAGDPPRVTVHLRQGCPDPLALMTFKIVPQPAVLADELRRPDPAEADKAFAVNPVGNGPFRYDGSRKSDERGRECRFFLTNFASARPLQPSIREVRFYLLDDPVKAFDQDVLDMALDLSPEQGAAVKDRGAVLLAPPSPRNHRVYFLAVNHRHPVLQNAAVRRALAYAINREQLLDDYFRKGLRPGYHKALNSPYPAGSWALNPAPGRKEGTSLDPFDPALARGLLAQEAKAVRRPITLSLKYPAGEDHLAGAMNALAEQVKEYTNGEIVLQVKDVDPHALRDEVEGAHTYELAYYHYDYPDETFWLGPLLGPRALPQGGNYLGYQGEAGLRVQNALAFRDFSELQKEARKTDEKLRAEMPLIPLWQLDPLIALRSHVKTVPFDPWRVFTDIDHWQLDRR